jgi:flavin-dependent dehydrogenase
LPFSIQPVVEDVVDRMELRLAFRPPFERACGMPVVLMTQRRRLDAYLVERSVAAGADFRDGARVTAVSSGLGGVTVEIGRSRIQALALIGADGVNGIVARSLGLCVAPLYGVALEGNLPLSETTPERYRGRIVFELGTVPGGYAWVFPKRDHVNVGVGGMASEAGRLREHLGRLCTAHGMPVERVEDVRGYRLPVARPDATLARGRALVCGDAAGLVDPLSGDGIYEALVSARHAADAVSNVLDGREDGLEPYEGRIKARLARNLAYSWAARRALERCPGLMFRFARLELVQQALERLARDEPAPFLARRLSKPLLVGLQLAGVRHWSGR